MPRRCNVDPTLEAVIALQDQVVHRAQARAAGLTPDAIKHRLKSGHWQILLPEIYLCHPGEPARRQRLIAALLHCGDESCIDGVDACRYHGLKSAAADDVLVHVAVPATSSVRSLRWVRVRRSSTPLDQVQTEMVRYLAVAPAVVAATRAMQSERAVIALFSEAVQRQLVTTDELLRAHIAGPRKNASLGDVALGHVRRGIRSAPEAEFRLLADAMRVLPPLLYNPVLLMPDGRMVSPDALAPDAPLIHETNGAVAHQRDDLFNDMQVRHDYLTSWGFTVLHNAPRRIRARGRDVIMEFARCYERLAGTGWPPGVKLIERAA